MWTLFRDRIVAALNMDAGPIYEQIQKRSRSDGPCALVIEHATRFDLRQDDTDTYWAYESDMEALWGREAALRINKEIASYRPGSKTVYLIVAMSAGNYNQELRGCCLLIAITQISGYLIKMPLPEMRWIRIGERNIMRDIWESLD